MMMISATFTSSDLHVSNDQRMIFRLRKSIISVVGLGFEDKYWNGTICLAFG